MEENIVRKVQNLLNRTVEKGATPEEMNTAIALAHRLMEKYSLSFEDIKKEDISIGASEKVEVPTKNANDFLLMANAIAELFHCGIVRTTTSRGKGRRSIIGYQVVGEVEHRTFVDFLIGEIFLNVFESFKNFSEEQKFNRHNILKEKYSFERGYFDAVRQKAENLLKEKEILKSSGTALMVIDSALVDYMDKTYTTARLKYTPRKFSASSYTAGVDAGKGQSLDRRLNNCKPLLGSAK